MVRNGACSVCASVHSKNRCLGNKIVLAVAARGDDDYIELITPRLANDGRYRIDELTKGGKTEMEQH